MSEIYIGTKFKYINKGSKISKNNNLILLKKWCNIFNENNFAPSYPGGSSGNLSFRIKKNNFIITASHTALKKDMNESDFAEVIFCSVENNIVEAIGSKEPSSEALMHYLIYENRADVNAVYHGHSNEIMKLAKQKGFPETKTEFDYGTIELAKEVVKTLKKHNFVILKNHGFVSVGKTQEYTGTQVLNFIKF